MKCPIDERELVMSERQGIEIDDCPRCRGGWLDRGELDQRIERAAEAQAPRSDRGLDRYDERDDRRSSGKPERREKYDDDRGMFGRKKKESVLSELFEFGG
jgi:Zn-finger nucleic acid-binding protein